MAVCEVCFRHCDIREGAMGVCNARGCKDGKIVAVNYGRVTALSLDPIEKKPLSRFCPGSKILSYGSYGCNLFCPFCQNYDISRTDGSEFEPEDKLTPEGLADIAFKFKDRGNIGVAYTYNEPLVSYEFVRDTAKLFHRHDLKTVLVSNGMASQEILQEILPYIDAMNIDLKGFTPEFYRDFVGGDLEMVKAFIRTAAESCHIEITKLIIPDKNDSEEEMRRMTEWIASLRGGRGRRIPLHVSRYFPRYKWTAPATPVKTVYGLADVAREKLDYVYTGNC